MKYNFFKGDSVYNIHNNSKGFIVDRLKYGLENNIGYVVTCEYNISYDESAFKLSRIILTEKYISKFNFISV